MREAAGLRWHRQQEEHGMHYMRVPPEVWGDPYHPAPRGYGNWRKESAVLMMHAFDKLPVHFRKDIQENGPEASEAANDAWVSLLHGFGFG